MVSDSRQNFQSDQLAHTANMIVTVADGKTQQKQEFEMTKIIIDYIWSSKTSTILIVNEKE